VTERFAILGWGSLLWDDTHPNFNAQIAAWQYDGPILPIEFSRISRSRGNALTLVIDSENGSPIKTAWCLSRRTTIAEAIEDLRERESTNARGVGYVHGTNQHARDARIIDTVREWAAAHKLDGAVWTDLASNFQEQKGRPFSIEAARKHLLALPDAGKAQARLYFLRAPVWVKTRLLTSVKDIFD
jgi:hypothetical protein